MRDALRRLLHAARQQHPTARALLEFIFRIQIPAPRGPGGDRRGSRQSRQAAPIWGAGRPRAAGLRAAAARRLGWALPGGEKSARTENGGGRGGHVNALCAQGGPGRRGAAGAVGERHRSEAPAPEVRKGAHQAFPVRGGGLNFGRTKGQRGGLFSWPAAWGTRVVSRSRLEPGDPSGAGRGRNGCGQ